ncbi:hypothetical protein ACFS6F_01460 [Halobacillus naozhouensis]
MKKEFKKRHPIRNFLGMLPLDKLQCATQDYFLNFEHTVFHADNTKEIIEYLVENSEIVDESLSE